MRQDIQNRTELFLNNIELSRWERRALVLFHLFCPTLALKIALAWAQPKTYQHCRNVETLSKKVGRECSLMFKFKLNMKYLEKAAFFHDIGKLCIKEEVLRKKHLTHSDKRLLNKHPELGAMIMSGVFPSPIRQTIGAHHEELDGSGYPKNVKGKEISLITRIVSTVDDFCAMTESRGYNVPLGLRDAIKELEKDLGDRYDPRVIDALKSVVAGDEHAFAKPVP